MTTAVLVRQCEALAQGLYNQCRDTSNPYKVLASGLRKIRNVLGDIDEALNDSHEPSSTDSKLTSSLSQARNILEKLDMALATYRCMSQADVDAGAVAGMRSTIEDVTQELATAYEKITRTGEISMSACSCVLIRKTSQGSKTSSSWSLVNRDVPDEKEVCQPSCSRLQPSASDTSLGSHGKTPSWRSISLDPLSKPIGDASKMILSSNSPIEAPSSIPPIGDLANTSVAQKHDQRGRAPEEDGSGDGEDSSQKEPSMATMPQSETATRLQNSPRPCELPCFVRSGDESYPKAMQVLGLTDARPLPSKNVSTNETCTTLDDANVRQPQNCAPKRSDQGQTPAPDSHQLPDQKLPTSPATRREERYKLMCCVSTEEPKSKRIPRAPSIGSAEDLYGVTPPKIILPENFKDASLYPDPLKLTKKLLNLDLNIRPLSNASRLQRGRRNSVGVPAELEGEPIRPPTRSSSCSSLPRYESVANLPQLPRRRVGSGRPLPSRYRQGKQLASATVAESTSIFEYPREKTPAATTLPSTPTFMGRRAADEVLKIAQSTKTRKRVQYAIKISDRTWYERDQEDTHAEILDQERISHIVHYWNKRQWAHAEQYLSAHLDEISTGSQNNGVRRTQHLLAVCASFRGEWDEAIRRFIGVLQKPIRKVTGIDDGDCAAAYWLGDHYAMQNRRADALLAYSLAENGSLFDDSALRSLVAGEQIAVQLGVSKPDFKRHWSQQALASVQKSDGAPSILDKDVISLEAAKLCLEQGLHTRDNRATGDFAELVRARHLYAFLLGTTDKLGVRPDLHEHMAMKIDVNCFDPDSPWPMPYDPLFCMSNVQRGRLLAYECDMLEVFKTNPEAKLPRPLSLTKLDCFTCNDLDWLILTIRACLKTYEIDHSEVVNVQGTWFCCRYSFMQHNIATTHYFSIALFKHPLRSSYGVDVCSEEGMCSARLVETAGYHKKGVHYQEPKRIKQLIKKYLHEAEKRVQSKGRETLAGSKTMSKQPSQCDIAWASSQLH